MPLTQLTPELIERIRRDAPDLRCLKLAHNTLKCVDHLHKLRSVAVLDLAQPEQRAAGEGAEVALVAAVGLAPRDGGAPPCVEVEVEEVDDVGA